MKRFLFFWFLAGLLEIPPVLFLLGKPLLVSFGFFTNFLFHGFSVWILAFCTPKKFGWFHGENLWTRSFLFLAGLMPFFGWLGCFLLFFSYHFYKPLSSASSGSIEEESEAWMDLPEFVVAPSSREIRQERIIKELDFLPLADIFSGDDVDLKRGAIDRLSQIKTPETIRILLSHRTDVNSDVRFYINAALERIKREFDEQLVAAREEIQKSQYKVSAGIFLAKTYLQYVDSQLLDPAMSHSYVESAKFHLASAIQTEYASVSAYWLLLDIYGKTKSWTKALETLSLLEKSKHGEVEKVNILKARVEIYYQIKNYEEVVHQLSLLDNLKLAEGEWKGMMYWWGVTT